MTNGPHQHTCSICHALYYCRILVDCFVEDLVAVCGKPACIDRWEAAQLRGEDEAE